MYLLFILSGFFLFSSFSYFLTTLQFGVILLVSASILSGLLNTWIKQKKIKPAYEYIIGYAVLTTTIGLFIFPNFLFVMINIVLSLVVIFVMYVWNAPESSPSADTPQPVEVIVGEPIEEPDAFSEVTERNRTTYKQLSLSKEIDQLTDFDEKYALLEVRIEELEKKKTQVLQLTTSPETYAEAIGALHRDREALNKELQKLQEAQEEKIQKYQQELEQRVEMERKYKEIQEKYEQAIRKSQKIKEEIENNLVPKQEKEQLALALSKAKEDKEKAEKNIKIQEETSFEFLEETEKIRRELGILKNNLTKVEQEKSEFKSKTALLESQLEEHGRLSSKDYIKKWQRRYKTLNLSKEFISAVSKLKTIQELDRIEDALYNLSQDTVPLYKNKQKLSHQNAGEKRMAIPNFQGSDWRLQYNIRKTDPITIDILDLYQKNKNKRHE